MSEFSIDVNRIDMLSTRLEECAKSLSNLQSKVSSISSDISKDGICTQTTLNTLEKIVDQLQQEESLVQKFSISLAEISGRYSKTEKAIASYNTKGYNKLTVKDNNWWDDYVSSYKENFWSNLRDVIIENSGNLILRLYGMFIVNKSPVIGVGEYPFVLVDESFSKASLFLSKMAPIIKTGAKYGLPIIGGAIDCATQIQKGEVPIHAALKATVHTVVSYVVVSKATELGAAIGTAVGTAFGVPPAGGAIGAAAGFSIGVAVSTAINEGFDQLYDSCIRNNIDNLIENMDCGNFIADRVGFIGA